VLSDNTVFDDKTSPNGDQRMVQAV